LSEQRHIQGIVKRSRRSSQHPSSDDADEAILPNRNDGLARRHHVVIGREITIENLSPQLVLDSEAGVKAALDCDEMILDHGPAKARHYRSSPKPDQNLRP
jgi:hypothetical protein